MKEQKPNLLIGVTGSVATIKLSQLLQMLQDRFNIRVVVTEHSKHFLKDMKLPENIQLFEDCMQWQWKQRGDPVLHIQLRKWAHCFLIAPLDAHTLAKISQGFCDNLLSLIARCWDMTLIELQENKLQSKEIIEQTSLKNCQEQSIKIKQTNKTLKFPFIVCPSMNTFMYVHPITNTQLDILKNWGITIIDPQIKTLVCGDKGIGAMASLQTINVLLQSHYNQILQRKKQTQTLN